MDVTLKANVSYDVNRISYESHSAAYSPIQIFKCAF